MAYVKKSGETISDSWMQDIVASVEADAIVDPVLMTQSSVGKARVCEDDGMLAVSFRLPKSRVIAIDETARRTGISRSLFLRTAVDCALMQGL